MLGHGEQAAEENTVTLSGKVYIKAPFPLRGGLARLELEKVFQLRRALVCQAKTTSLQ